MFIDGALSGEKLMFIAMKSWKPAVLFVLACLPFLHMNPVKIWFNKSLQDIQPGLYVTFEVY